MSRIYFCIAFIFFLLNLNESLHQLTDTTTKQPQTIKDSIMLPYILKKQNENNLKRYTLLTTNSGTDNLEDVANEDISSPTLQGAQEKNTIGMKASKTDDWDRVNYYIPTHLNPMKFPTFNAYDTTAMNPHNYSNALPATIMILINIGILSYVIIGMLGFFNRLLQPNTAFPLGGYGNSGQFHFKSVYNDDF